MKALAPVAIALALTACSGAPTKPPPQVAKRVQAPVQPPRIVAAPAGVRRSPYAPAQEDISKRGNYTRGGLYAPGIQDSAPAGLPDVDAIPEPEVKAEVRSLYGNRSPYQVLGQTYRVVDDPAQYDEVGLASFYGNKFHGRRTSNLEVYDMYAFSAASKTLPLPSFARVTNLANGKSVVVRVNDRGPFHEGRIIDLSYAAAVKLGVDRAGTARVEVKGLDPGQIAPAPDVGVAENPTPVPLVLPPDVRVATGRPAAVGTAVVAAPTAIDRLLSGLPIASANASERPPQAAPQAAPPAATVVAPVNPRPTGERFDMRQDGRTMTADEFDAWLRSRRLHVATGKAATPVLGPPPAAAAAVPAPAAVAVTPQLVSTVAAPPTAIPATPSPAPADATAITYQVASFAARTNAEHALSVLAGAGIQGARLLDADANGRKVWRLRVGPINAASAPELVARIAGLGFGQPQRVRE